MLSEAAKVAYHRRMTKPLVSYKDFDICPVTKKPAIETSIINNLIVKTCDGKCGDVIKQGLETGTYSVKNNKLYKLEDSGMKFVQAVQFVVDTSYGLKQPHLDDCSCYICTNTLST